MGKDLRTRERLEGITDRGMFESLVVSVLRKTVEDYAYIIQTGINALGETIKSPIDGFCRVPGSDPPHFLMVCTTTTDRTSLRSKWLGAIATKTKSKAKTVPAEADLMKAGNLAKEVRREFYNAKLTVILATNQRLEHKFILEVTKKADEAGLVSDIWEQSRIGDFLDDNPEGHWIRRKFLGVEAERLSESLLRELCQLCASRYEKELFLIDASKHVERESDRTLRQEIVGSAHSMLFLVGDSGFGKTSAAYRALQEHLTRGGLGLWLPANVIKECVCLEDAISKVLDWLHPSLMPDVQEVLPGLIPKGDRLLLVVDDLNRVEAPAQLVRRLVAWSGPPQSDTPDSKSPSSPYLLVVPIWPNIWASSGHAVGKIAQVRAISIGPMQSKESEQVVTSVASQAGVEITKAEASNLAARMGNDPLLISLFGSVLSSGGAQNMGSLAENIIEEFMVSSCEEAGSASGSSHLATEYTESLSEVGSHMIQTRNFHPLWEDVCSWLGGTPRVVEALRELVKHGKLCRVTDDDRFAFRHDRIQENVVTRCMEVILKQDELDNALLADPFFASVLAQALCCSPQESQLIKSLREHSPLALVEAIRHFGKCKDDYCCMIIEEVKVWITEEVASGLVPDAIIDAVCWSLLETDSPVVLEITELLPENFWTLLARLRNGCARSGVTFCSDRSFFVPGTTNDLRDKIVDHAKKRHKRGLSEKLGEVLRSTEIIDETRKGALVLAGFLGFDELSDAVKACWDLIEDKTSALSEAIWAGTQCCGAECESILDPMIVYWAALPDKEDSSGMSTKSWVAQELCFAFARGISMEVIQYLISQASLHETLRWPITHACERVDAPSAIEFIAESMATTQRKIAGSGGFSPWSMVLFDNWNPSRRGGRRMSQDCRFRLEELWKDMRNDTFTRRASFRLWLAGVDISYVGTLKAIPGTDSDLFRHAIWKRAQLGDQSVVPQLLPFLESDTNWCNVASYVWSDKVMGLVHHHLESFQDDIPSDFSGGQLNPHYDLSRLLIRAPVVDSEKLLESNWKHLKCSPLFVHAALHTATPRCRELAALSIAECPKHIPIFEHIAFCFGLMDSGGRKHLKLTSLESLNPYLERMGAPELSRLAEVCQHAGFQEWGRQYLPRHLDPKTCERYYPTEGDLLQDLDEFESDQHRVWTVQLWMEDFDRRHDSKEQIIPLLEKWLQTHRTEQALQVAARCIELIGVRGNLPILDRHEIKGTMDTINKLKAGTKFFVRRRSLD